MPRKTRQVKRGFNMPNKGYKQTKEHRRKIKEHHSHYWKNKKFSEIHKKQLREVAKRKGIRPPRMEREKNPKWKGGKWQRKSGHWLILIPTHPFAGKKGYVRRSRLVAEKCLGRYLTQKEVIHHINGNSSDDRLKNLYLFSTQSRHNQYEKSKNKTPLKSNLINKKRAGKVHQRILGKI